MELARTPRRTMKQNFSETFGCNVQTLRKKMGLSAAKLAEITSIKSSRLNDIEQGSVEHLRLPEILSIESVLQCGIRNLFSPCSQWTKAARPNEPYDAILEQNIARRIKELGLTIETFTRLVRRPDEKAWRDETTWTHRELIRMTLILRCNIFELFEAPQP